MDQSPLGRSEFPITLPETLGHALALKCYLGCVIHIRL